MKTSVMRKRIQKLLGTMFVVGIFTLPASAGSAFCSENSCIDEINRLYVDSHDGKPRVFVDIEDRSLADRNLNCDLVSGRYFTLEGDHPAFEQIFELLVEAKKGRTQGGRNGVRFRLRDNSPNCEILYVMVDWPNEG